MLKQYVTNEDGSIESVILDYKYYKEIEPFIEDFLLGKIIEDSESDDEYSFEESKKILGIE